MKLNTNQNKTTEIVLTQAERHLLMSVVARNLSGKEVGNFDAALIDVLAQLQVGNKAEVALPASFVLDTIAPLTVHTSAEGLIVDIKNAIVKAAIEDIPVVEPIITEPVKPADDVPQTDNQ